MKTFSKMIAGVGALVLTVVLMGLPDLSMAQVPGAAAIGGVHSTQVWHVLAKAS
jgi:hypothetical protein